MINIPCILTKLEYLELTSKEQHEYLLYIKCLSSSSISIISKRDINLYWYYVSLYHDSVNISTDQKYERITEMNCNII